MPSRQWLDYVANGEAYSAENFQLGGVGLIAHVQIFNPVASGKRVRVRSFHTTSTVVSASSVRRHDVALTTLGVPAGFVVENMLGGGPAEVAEMRSANLGVVTGALFWQISADASTPAIYPPGGREWGFDLLEGQGILVQGSTGLTVIVNWQWAEVPL